MSSLSPRHAEMFATNRGSGGGGGKGEGKGVHHGRKGYARRGNSTTRKGEQVGVAVKEKRRDRVNWFLTPSQPQRRREQETRKLYFTRKREKQVGVAMLESQVR